MAADQIILIFVAWSVVIIFQAFHRHCLANAPVEKINEQPLHDIGHIYLPNISKHYLLGDAMIVILVTAFIMALALTRNAKAMQHFAIAIALLIAIKSVMSIFTVLPDPSGFCNEKHNGSPYLKVIFGDCNALMFSGHCAIAFLVAFYIHDLYKISALTALTFAYVLTLCLVTVATRNHYTIDVAVAFFVAYTIYHIITKR